MSQQGILNRIHDAIKDFVIRNQKLLTTLEFVQLVILASIYLSAWIDPYLFSLEFVYTLQMLMLFEFVLVHSGMFMGLGGWTILFFLPFYLCFALVMNLLTPDNTILYLFTYTICMRVLWGFGKYKRKVNTPIFRSMFRAFATYMPLLIISILLGTILPDLGLTPDVQKAIEDTSTSKSNGDITLKIVVIFGFLYYTGLIIWEYYFLKLNKASVNILYVSSNEIGAILKSRITRFGDYIYQIEQSKEIDLENFDLRYDFVGKRDREYSQNITDNIELIIVTEERSQVEKLKLHLEELDLSHIPIIDLSDAINSIKEEILDAYRQRVPEHFQEIPNKHHPIKRSINWSIFDDVVRPQLIDHWNIERYYTLLDPKLHGNIIRKLEKIKLIEQ